MVIDEGHLPFSGGHTWYRIARADDTPLDAAGVRPLLALHGGPGATHDFLLCLDDLVTPERPVVYYDQFGNGRSTHRPDAPPGFWTVSLFLGELATLVAHLGLDRGYDLLGQSWGGMLGAEHAVLRPPGMRRLVLADAPASMPLWRKATAELRAALPEETRGVLDAHERAGTVDSAEYAAATEVFYRRHVLRIDPMPEPLARTFRFIEENPSVYRAMNGPNEFHVTGSLREWSIVDRLDRVAAPTLVLNGRHDEATDETVAPFLERIPGARGHTFPGSSHLPLWEERADFMAVVRGFLDEP